MQFIEFSINDDLMTVARKCNRNFTNMKLFIEQLSKKITREHAPQVGTYVIADNIPVYDDTTWQQAGTISTNSNVTIPVWKRTS